MAEPQYSVPQVPREIFSQQNHLPISDEIISYISDRPLEYVPNVGILVYIVGATYPKKGMVTPDVIGHINIIKSLIKESFRYPLQLLVTNKTKLLTSFNTLAEKTIAQHRLQPMYMCRASFYFMQFLEHFLKDLGFSHNLAQITAHNISQILEYDDSYRYQVQDLAAEAVTHNLRKSPLKEILRLHAIFKQRANKRVAKDMTKILAVVIPLLLVPKVRKAFTKNVHFIKCMQYDDGDRYWAYLKNGEYEYGGIPYEERTQGWQIPTPYKITGI